MKLRIAVDPAALLRVDEGRLALATWLLARRHDASVALRLDDAGAPGQDETIQQDLRWLGLDWDGVVRQSERSAAYEAAIERLKGAGRLYPCFESEDELTFKRELRRRQGKAAIYDRAMLKMTGEQRARAEAGGKVPYWRFLLSGVGAEWGDMVLGKQSVKMTAISDPVLVRADGTPSWTLASVVDDVEFGATHVLRGADQVTNTGIQLDIRAALGMRLGTIRFGHLPALEETGGKGGKRAGLPTLRSLRADGIEPAALAGLLARLGTPDAVRPEPAALLAAGWDLSRVGKTMPRFDPQRLLEVNHAALAAMPFEAAQDRLPPAATPAFWLAVRGHLDLMREARGWWDVVAGTIVPPLMDTEAETLGAALAVLPAEPWDGGTWAAWLEAVQEETGLEEAALTPPLRLALTGEDHGPELVFLLPLMGRARVSERLRLAAS